MTIRPEKVSRFHVFTAFQVSRFRVRGFDISAVLVRGKKLLPGQPKSRAGPGAPAAYFSFQDDRPAGLFFPLQFAVDLAFAEAHLLGYAFHGLALVEFFLLHQFVDAGSGVLLFDGGLALLLCLTDE